MESSGRGLDPDGECEIAAVGFADLFVLIRLANRLSDGGQLFGNNLPKSRHSRGLGAEKKWNARDRWVELRIFYGIFS